MTKRPGVSIAKTFFSFLKNARCEAWAISGPERSGGEPLTVIFAGTAIDKSYLVRRIFGDGVQERSLGRLWRWRATTEARRACEGAALLFSAVPWSYERLPRPDSFAELPAWIAMRLPLNDHAAVQATSRFKKSRALAERGGLTREATRDPKEFSDFYRRIYMPYIESRHGEGGILSSHKAARAEFLKKGQELLLIKHGPSVVGGIVLEYRDGQAFSRQMGLADDEVGRKASDPLHYHLLAHLMGKNLPALHMGTCRPFLSDGIVEYKRSWGARLISDRPLSKGLWALHILKETPALKSFLLGNPFIAVDRGEAYHLYGFADGGDDPPAALLSKYCAPGLIDLRSHAVAPHIRRISDERPLP